MSPTTPQLLDTPAAPPDRAFPDARRPPDARANDAWMREMERVQIASWFQPAGQVEPAPSRAHATSSPAGLPVRTLPPTPIGLDQTAYAASQRCPPGAEARHSTAHASGISAPAPLHKRPSNVSANCVAPAEATPQLTRAVQTWLTQALARAEAASRPAPTASPAQDQPAMRLHLEPGQDGIAVWIGARPDDIAIRQHLPLLLETLQRKLQEHGLRLASLTLNGRTLWQPSMPATPYTPKETPWPSTQ